MVIEEAGDAPNEDQMPLQVPIIEYEATLRDTPQAEMPVPPRIDFLDEFIENTISVEQRIDDFINQLQSLYKNFFARIDIEQWHALLNSDVMWQVEDKELLNDRMMGFLHDHHHLPKNVWQLLERNFYWRKEKEYLLNRYPAAFHQLHFQAVGPGRRAAL